MSENDTPQRMRLVRVHFMPKELESGVLYVSEEYGTAAHLCACGCGAKIRTPLGPEEWSVYETKHGPSLYPSVGNWQQKCRSHYWITRGEIRWSYPWTPQQVAAGRRDEQERMRAHFTLRAVEKLLTGAAPERAAEVSALLNSYGIIFYVAPDMEGFTLEAGAYSLVRFTERSLEQLWILGHAAWRALDAYGAYIATVADHRISAEEIASLPGQAEAERAFNLAVDAAHEIGHAAADAVRSWPAGIPERDPEVKRTDEEQATLDLIILATAYTFLHEAKHVAFAADGDGPADPRDEELECDRFARSFLLELVDQYATSSGAEPALVLNKRTMGIALGLFFIVALTPADRRSGSRTHPGLVERLADVLADASERTLIFFCSLLIAWLRRNGSMPQEIAYADRRDLLQQLIARLDS